MKKISLKDKFFAPRQLKNISVTIPAALKRFVETGRIDAFKLQWTPGSSLPMPHIFWDSDVAKVMEGMAYVAGTSPEIAARLEELVDLVISAQQPDGYLNTHFTVTEQDQRWQNLTMNHELYCAGHLTEAAVAHWQATGNRRFLDAMCRYCDYICDYFGENGNQGYPGHQELELALVKLYKVTGESKYLEQAKRFIIRRGSLPNYLMENEKKTLEQLIFCQAHKPVAEQIEAEGHAVRILYMCCSMADIAKETGDRQMLELCQRFFDDITQNKMYITGGIGSRQIGEFVGGSGDQIAERSYAESCAAIAMVFFASRMLNLTGQAKYAEIMEKTLFNCAMSGLSLSGDKFFYANLHSCHRGMKPAGHVYQERQPWHWVSCCPTSYCRFLPQIGNYCCRVDSDSLAVDIPVAAEIGNENFAVEVISNYPWDGKFSIRIKKGGKFSLSVRIPLWCKKFSTPQSGKITDAYWQLNKDFADGEILDFNFDMPVEKVFTTIPSQTATAALCRGPLVYCVEQPYDAEFTPFEVLLCDESKFQLASPDNLPDGCVELRFNALRLCQPAALYSTDPGKVEHITVSAIPYAFWQNRKKSEMVIFMPYCLKY